MSVAALPSGMLGARSRLRPLPLSLAGWCVSCYNNNNNNNNNNKNNKNNNINNKKIIAKIKIILPWTTTLLWWGGLCTSMNLRAMLGARGV